MNDRTDVSNSQPVTRDAQPVTRDSGIETRDSPRRRGAPKGNCNARRHGCRSARIVEAQRKIIKEETDYGGLDRDILLAIWQLAIVNGTGATTRVAARLALRFARLVSIKYGVHSDDEAAFVSACERLKFDLPLTKELAAKLGAAFKEPVAPPSPEGID